DAAAWLDDTAERIYAVLAGSNFYTEGAQIFEDLSTFATAPMLIYEDFEDVIRCYVPCAGEYFLAVGGRLSVDAFLREYTYTVAQMVDWFGLDHCPKQVRQHWLQGGASLEREFVVGHAVEPNFPLAARGKADKKLAVVSGDFTYREVYWLRGQRTEAP